MANDFDSINGMTGFADGTEFSNDAEVVAYFTVENMKFMFDDDGVKDQDELDEMAEAVIQNRWHMVAFTSKYAGGSQDLEDLIAERGEDPDFVGSEPLTAEPAELWRFEDGTEVLVTNAGVVAEGEDGFESVRTAITGEVLVEVEYRTGNRTCFARPRGWEPDVTELENREVGVGELTHDNGAVWDSTEEVCAMVRKDFHPPKDRLMPMNVRVPLSELGWVRSWNGTTICDVTI